VATLKTISLLLLIGGVLILVAGLANVILAFSAQSIYLGTTANVTITSSNQKILSSLESALEFDGAIAAVFGVVVMISGYFVRKNKSIKVWSSIGIICCAVALLFGGIFAAVGFIISLIGGILGLLYKPNKVKAAA
jgi:hypothetical protein